MLRFVEEIILLLLGDEDGRFANVPSWSLSYALAGAVLMDLAIEDRIDTDLEKLVVVDSSPLGDSLLDPALAEIAGREQRDVSFWLERIANHADQIRDEALSRLVAKGILAHREDRFLWVFESRRYPAIDGKAEREVKLRIMGVLFSDEIPHPRDVMVICLADACGIFGEILARHELGHVSGRIEQVRKLDLIGRAMTQAIRDIEFTVAASIQARMF